MLNVLWIGGHFVDLNLGDLTTETPTFLDYAAMGLSDGSLGQWYKGGFLLCSIVGGNACRHYSLNAGTWYVLYSVVH